MKNELSKSRRDFLKNSAKVAMLLSVASITIICTRSKKEYDMLIKNGLLFDDNGTEGKELDILITDLTKNLIGKKQMARGIEKLNKIKTAHIWANNRNCVACWKCIDSCPKQVIGKVSFLWHKHIVIKNSENCIGCKKCIQVCPNKVFSETIPDLLKNILEKKGFKIFVE